MKFICRLQRDRLGSFGIEITEGEDGGVYIQSVQRGGAAAKLGTIHRGKYHFIFSFSVLLCVYLNYCAYYILLIILFALLKFGLLKFILFCRR